MAEFKIEATIQTDKERCGWYCIFKGVVDDDNDGYPDYCYMFEEYLSRESRLVQSLRCPACIEAEKEATSRE